MNKNYLSKIAAGVLLVAGAKAQVATLYTFSQQSGVYTAVTGGSVYGTTTSDDQAFVDPSAPAGGATSGPGIPIGFAFMFNNNIYNRIAIQNNGWIAFGSSTLSPAVNINTSSNYTGLSATSTAPAALQNRVAALALDIQAQTGSELRVATIGTAPTRTCVIQWTNYKKYGTNGTGDNFNFQIQLLETTNIVQLVYGAFTNNATSGAAEVGLRGNSNADYNNRIVATANPWNASIAGTANNSSAAFNSTLVPANGQMYIWTPQQCSGTLTASLTAVASPTMVCPNYGSTITVSGTPTISGIYQTWYVSNQSSVGNWTAIPGEAASMLAAPGITTTSWYYASATCIHSSSSATTNAVEVDVAQTTTASVPYYEGFEGITIGNTLPNCSWFSAGLGTSFTTYTSSTTGNRIPRGGNNFGAYSAVTTTNYVYTNGIQMEPGVTYSAALYFATDFAGSNNWTELTISIGNAQTAASQVSVVSASPAISGTYKLLSGLFTVPNSGLYYMSIRATGGTAGAPYLMIDDISITIPCTPESGNSPTVTAQGGSQTACLGQSFPVTANGADEYLWSDSSVGSSTVVTPGFLGTNTFVVVGTKTLTGCTATAAVLVTVYASPILNVVASPPVVCEGKSVILTASGANVYNWNNGGSTSQIVVTPATSTSFVAIGTSSNGCMSSASVSVTVLPLPTIDASSTRTNICVGESTSLMATGGDSYVWIASKSSNMLQGGTVTVSPGSSDTFTVTGTAANGCQNTDVVTVVVDECLGLNQISGKARLNVYPNPTAGELVIEGLNVQNLDVVDISGRVLLSRVVTGSAERISLSEFANGVYYIKAGADVIRIIKE